MDFHTFLSIITIIFLLFKHEIVSSEEFNYNIESKYGPNHWGEIRKDWAACNKGKMQSPIDLNNRRVQFAHQLGDLKRSYHPAKAVMNNRGHDIMVKWEEEDAGGIWINGSLFNLQQVHWHTPSEHTIDSRNYSMELHMVHLRANASKVAVVGVLYTIGRSDSFLAKMMKYIKMVSHKKNAEVKIEGADPRDIKSGRKYYRYMGSLTTPPCTEGVIWTIIKKVRTVSKKQLRVLKEAVEAEYEKNARPKQPIGERVVQLYEP